MFLIPSGGVVDKVMSNLEEIKARGGPVIAVAPEGDEELAHHVLSRADEVIFVPQVPDYLQPLVAAVPLQLLAYHDCGCCGDLRCGQAAQPGEERDGGMT